MIRNTYENIEKGIEVRQNLIRLRQEIKDSHERHALQFFLGGNYSLLLGLLSHEDAKVRKNTALILGALQEQKLLQPLYEAYEAEETMFVKSSYLLAMKEYDCSEYREPLRQRLAELSSREASLDNKKHLMEETRALSDLLILSEGIKPHKFTGWRVPSELILLTNRNFIQEIMETLPQEFSAKAFNAGIMLSTDSLPEIVNLRYYEELLFAVKGMKTCPMNAKEAARKMSEADILSFMKARHEGGEPFYFRVECKSSLAPDKKSALTKNLAAELERLTNRRLINSTSRYEFEIRLIENKAGDFNVLLKLFTMSDERFSYRKEVTATSIKPVNAALVSLLAADYLKEEARLLDPFCGTGTMLIERHKLKKANTMYGVDIYGEAIEKARQNTEQAHQIIHYINRDFFDFRHEYLFDEIITNMPFEIGRTGKEDIRLLYERFFEKAKTHLEADGILVLYSHNRELVTRFSAQYGYTVKEVFEISKKEGTYVYILSVQQ